MSFTDLFESGTHRKNLSHFAAIVSLAKKNGVITNEEEELMKRFASRLNLSDEEYNEVLKHPSRYPLIPPISADSRLQHMLDFFQIVYIDHKLDEGELDLLKRYAIAVGYSEEIAAKLIRRSIEIFTGGLDLEDYRYLLNRK